MADRPTIRPGIARPDLPAVSRPDVPAVTRPDVPAVTRPVAAEPVVTPTIKPGTTVPTREPKPPTKDTAPPPTEDTAPPATEDTAPPPTEDTAPPPTEDTAPPPTEDTAPPPTEDFGADPEELFEAPVPEVPEEPTTAPVETPSEPPPHAPVGPQQPATWIDSYPSEGHGALSFSEPPSSSQISGVPWTQATTADGQPVWIDPTTNTITTSPGHPPIPPTPDGPLTLHLTPQAAIDAGFAPITGHHNNPLMHPGNRPYTYDPDTGLLTDQQGAIVATDADQPAVPHPLGTGYYIPQTGEWVDHNGHPTDTDTGRYLTADDPGWNQILQQAANPHTGELPIPPGIDPDTLAYDPATNTFHAYDPEEWGYVEPINDHTTGQWVNLTTGQVHTHPNGQPTGHTLPPGPLADDPTGADLTAPDEETGDDVALDLDFGAGVVADPEVAEPEEAGGPDSGDLPEDDGLEDPAAEPVDPFLTEDAQPDVPEPDLPEPDLGEPDLGEPDPGDDADPGEPL